MDQLDGFYQAMDSKRMLDEHGPGLVAEARGVLTRDPSVRVAGMITMPDAPEAGAIRGLLAEKSGRVPPVGVMVGLVPRASVERMLPTGRNAQPWMEQGWQGQAVLPVVVSTRDGYRFGFFPLFDQSRPTQM